jgi:YebC/PmpR family DNA-binding regulatory protein
MSGHSKWSTIKRQKEAKDIVKGKVFSKLSKMISIAVKTGGGPDPDTNYRLRMAIDKARSSNMPKGNIEKAILKGKKDKGSLEEVVYEGFGPSGIAVIVEVATDNRNRTAQEVKNIFERVGGRLGGPGSVTFNFEPKGLLLVKKKDNVEGQMLELIDKGVENIEETRDGVEVYTSVADISKKRKQFEDSGFEIVSAEMVQDPKNLQLVSDEKTARKAVNFLESLNDHEDVQKVYANIDIPDSLLKEVENKK